MPQHTRIRGDILSARTLLSRRGAPPGLGEPAKEVIDLGFATTIYGRDKTGNLVEINEAGTPLEQLAVSRPPWPTEQ